MLQGLNAHLPIILQCSFSPVMQYLPYASKSPFCLYLRRFVSQILFIKILDKIFARNIFAIITMKAFRKLESRICCSCHEQTKPQYKQFWANYTFFFHLELKVIRNIHCSYCVVGKSKTFTLNRIVCLHLFRGWKSIGMYNERQTQHVCDMCRCVNFQRYYINRKSLFENLLIFQSIALQNFVLLYCCHKSKKKQCTFSLLIENWETVEFEYTCWQLIWY